MSFLIVSLAYAANMVYGDKERCSSWFDLVTSTVFFAICLLMMYHSIKVNNVVEHKQASELGQIDISNYRPSQFLSLDLEVFWDRFSWFQLLIASLILRCLSDIFTVCVAMTYISADNTIDSCQLVYPLIYNPTKPDDIPSKYHIIAIAVTALSYLMTDFLPYIFMIRIIEVSLIKKRYPLVTPAKPSTKTTTR